MKRSSTIRASHVNTGTSFRQSYRAGSKRGLRHPKLVVEEEQSEAVPYGGLSLAATLVRSLNLPRSLDNQLDMLRDRRPYRESDHILTHVYNLYLGGNSIEDISYLQGSEGMQRMLGADRIPDPTTAGDFLKRFDEKNLRALDAVIDEAHERVWRKAHGGKKRQVGYVDLDSHIHPIYGDQKEGADFSYTGAYGYHPFVISLAGTQEVLRLHNRSGNVTSADGVAVELERVMPLLTRNFRTIIVRGDTAFVQREIFEVCEEFDQYFAIGAAALPNRVKIAQAVPEAAWQPFSAHSPVKKSAETPRRRRGTNLRRQTARRRKMRDLRLQRQWISEVPYAPDRSEEEYRLVIRRQKIEESKQGELFVIYRYRFVLTNLPTSYPAEEVIRSAYRRCDQENVIEQLQHGVSAMRMPSGSFAANSAFLLCARLAFNLKAWLGMLALPREVVRWEWKRFRQAFVYFVARVIYKARQIIVRIADAHRFAQQVRAGILQLQV